jgi:AraC-like DNA-binding protein
MGPRLVMTEPSPRKADLPTGVNVTTKSLRGPRRTVRNTRRLGQEDRLRARWPMDGLVETDCGPIIICVAGGHVDYQVGEHVIHCGEGHFILVPPGAPYSDGQRPHYAFDPASPSASDFCDLLWLTCYARGIQCWTCHCRGAEHGVFPGQQCLVLSETASQLLDLLMEEAAAAQAGWQDVCHDYLHAALILIRREIVENRVLNADVSGEAQASSSPHLDPIEKAQQYIRTHLKHKLTIDRMARHVFMSRTRFTERFRQHTGQSFAEFLTRCRVEEAQALLRDSDWSVTRISHRVGLKSLPYFCEMFARHVGQSPQAFRDQARSQRRPVKPPGDYKHVSTPVRDRRRKTG